MEKVIVTGAGGFIGKALTIKLLSSGVKVYGIDISLNKIIGLKEYGNFVPVVADFSIYEKLHEMIDERNFDAFYHFAWNGVFGDSFKNYSLQLDNVKYACNAISEAQKLGCKKMIFAGTMNEYEIKSYINMDYFEPRFTCIYGMCKIAAEMILKTLAFNCGMEYCGGLIAMAYGENNYSKMLPNMVINQLINVRNPKLIEGNNFYDMIYIDDISSAFIAIGEKGVNMKSYYIGHRNLKTFRELMTDIRDILNPQAQLLFGEYKDTVNMDYSLIDLNALYNDTGFECKSDFKESILKTAEWVKSLNWE